MTLDEEETDVTGDEVTGETREDRRSWPRRVLAGAVFAVMELVACVVGSVAAQDEPRTALGRPDFSGTYDTATVTPLQRPVELDRLSLTREQAAEIARERAEFAANAEPWSGEYSWRQTSARLYEYACHEGNYAMGGIMRGGRILEREALEAGNR